MTLIDCSERVQGDERAEDRQRDRGEHDDRWPPGAEQQQDDETDQRGGDHHFVHDVRDRLLHETRGVDKEFHLYALGHDLFDARDDVLDPLHHLQGRRLAALHHDDDDSLLAINYHGICLHTAREARHADVAQMNPGITLLLDRDVVEVLDLQRLCVGQNNPVG